MRKFIKCILVLVVLAGIGCLLVFFKQSHSAKERLREEGIRYYRMGQYDNASDCFTLALKQSDISFSDMDKDIYYYLADGELKQGKFGSAITYYDKLMSLGEKGCDLYLNLGICLEQTDKLEQAYKYYKLAVEQDKKNSDLYYYLCSITSKLNLEDDCVEYAKKGYSYLQEQISDGVRQRIQNKDSSNITVAQTKELEKCGQLAYLSGKYEEAYQYYVLLDQAGDENAKMYMGHCLAEKGEYEKALSMLDTYEQNHGIQPLSIAKRIFCYMQMNQYDKALSLMDQAMSMKNQKLIQELLFEKGTALEKTGDFDGAFDCFASYVESYPNDKAAKREYDFLVTRISNEKAVAAGVDNGNL